MRKAGLRYAPLLLALVGALVLAAAGGAAEAKPIKAAWIYVGPHNDGGWSQAHDDGRLYVQKKLGKKVITTYKENADGAVDTAYLDVNTLLTLGYLRFDWRNLLLRKYPRHKLANDGTRYGTTQAVVTPKLIKAEAIAWFRAMEELGLVEGIDQFKNDLVVQRNGLDKRRPHHTVIGKVVLDPVRMNHRFPPRQPLLRWELWRRLLREQGLLRRPRR